MKNGAGTRQLKALKDAPQIFWATATAITKLHKHLGLPVDSQMISWIK